MDRTAAELPALIDGPSVHVLLYPDRLDAAAAAHTLDTELDRITRRDEAAGTR